MSTSRLVMVPMPEPDLEHPRPDERTDQAEDVVRVSPGLLHRFQVVGGVAVLCLAESAVGVRDVLHALSAR